MNSDINKQDTQASKPVFVAIFFSFYAWGLLEVAMFSGRATLRPQLFSALFGIAFLFLSCRSSLHYYGSFMAMLRSMQWTRRRLTASDGVSAAILLAVGYMLGNRIGEGYLELWLLSAIVCFIPWIRIPFCRDYFITACVLMWFAAGIGVMNGVGTSDMISLSLAAWNFWAAALLAAVWDYEKHRRVRRSLDSKVVNPGAQRSVEELVKPE